MWMATVSAMSSRLVAARILQPAITIQVRQTTMALVLNWTLAVYATAVVFRMESVIVMVRYQQRVTTAMATA